MRKFLILACMMTLTGCAWLGFGDDSNTTAAPADQDITATHEEPAPVTTEPAKAEPQKATKTTSKKTAKGAKSEAQIKAELDAMGKRLAGQSARTLLPNKSKPEYKQVGKDWVASYIDVDTNNVTTEMRPGSNGQYVGFIRYQERFMECRGATKQTALQGNCQQVRTRNLNELIRYDGKEWQD